VLAKATFCRIDDLELDRLVDVIPLRGPSESEISVCHDLEQLGRTSIVRCRRLSGPQTFSNRSQTSITRFIRNCPTGKPSAASLRDFLNLGRMRHQMTQTVVRHPGWRRTLSLTKSEARRTTYQAREEQQTGRSCSSKACGCPCHGVGALSQLPRQETCGVPKDSERFYRSATKRDGTTGTEGSHSICNYLQR